MKHNFEVWLTNQNLDHSTEELFQESFNCYKAESYRASLLFSYLALQSFIRSRLRHNSVPEGYTEGEWKHCLDEILQDEYLWDTRIFKLVELKKKPVFNISQEVFEQYVYWKNRRNDCAHAKGNQISYPHVESFWLFLQSNMLKFVVNGGKNYILKLVENHLNITITPPNTSSKPIVDKVVSVVEPIHFNELWEEISTLFDQKFRLSAKFEFFAHALKDTQLQTSVISFFKKSSSRLIQFLQYRPNSVNYFNDPKTVRRIWRNLKQNHEYPLFIALLRNDLIHIDQKEEAFEYILNNLDTAWFNENFWDENMSISPDDLHIMKQSGFIDHFYSKAFTDKLSGWDFYWANRNRYLITFYLLNHPLDKEISITLNMIFNRINTPNQAKKILLSFINRNTEVFNDYKEHCTQEQLECQLIQ